MPANDDYKASRSLTNQGERTFVSAKRKAIIVALVGMAAYVGARTARSAILAAGEGRVPSSHDGWESRIEWREAQAQQSDNGIGPRRPRGLDRVAGDPRHAPDAGLRWIRSAWVDRSAAGSWRSSNIRPVLGELAVGG